jgi:hypothetical protein
MTKPDSASGYDKKVTDNCERVLVTLLRGLGPRKNSVYLIGGLTPRYLAPKVQHVGTTDVDIVVHLQMLTETDAYQTLEQNLKNMGFERAQNAKGENVSWRWRAKVERGVSVILELLADDPNASGGRVMALPAKGNVSALNIPHSSIVYDLHDVIEVRADLLDEGGTSVENVRIANIVSFTSLKAFALDQRKENKDAYDIVFCITNAPGGLEAIAKAFNAARAGKHREVINEALAILKKRFADDGVTEGYRKDGAVSVAQFEIDGDSADAREARLRRQREVSDLIGRLLKAIG